MKIGKKIYALLIAGILTLGSGIGALAAEKPVPHISDSVGEQSASVSVTKELELAEGITVPTATFNFKVTPLTKEAGVPTASIKPISFSAQDTKGNLVDGKYIISKNSALEFSGQFPHAGEYLYEVTQDKLTDSYTSASTSTDTDAMVYNDDVYKVHVYVANGNTDGTLYIKTITAEKNPPADSQISGEKVAKIVFTNTYTKDTKLVIEKQTAGTYADKTKAFDFKVTLKKSPTSLVDEVVGKVGMTDYRFTFGPTGVAEQTVALKHGEKLVFDTIAAGTKYTVTELSNGVKDGYVPEYVIDGNTLGKVTGNDNADLSTSELVVKENGNNVTYTNNYDDHNVPITGIFMNNLPFILLIAVAAAGLIAITFIKRKKGIDR